MDDVKELLERQAAWQKSRKLLSWPEKIRIAESIRESVVKLRRTGPASKPGTAASERPR
jgi:hypothetical protein